MSSDLMRRFEPILYFHKDETFFPSDAKRYLEHCALWKANAPFSDKTSWKEMIPTRGIAAASDEVSQPGEPDDVYLGQQQGTEFPFVSFIRGEQERFLNPSGWINADGTHEHDASPTTSNRFAALELLERFYGNTAQTIEALRDSRFWYHAEAFDTAQLDAMTIRQNFTLINVNKFLKDSFKEPRILCYYLFFPGHVEPLQGCEDLVTGKNFGSFAGEWVCVSILLDRDDPAQDFEPKFLGLASRNANKNGDPAAQGRVLDDESRIGMVIHAWSDADLDVFASEPDHVRLFVAKGTHSLYLKPGERVLLPLRSGDPSSANCGASEPLSPTIIENPEQSGAGEIFLGKIVAGAAALSAVGAAPLGVVAGIAWSILEDKPVINTPFDTRIPPPAPEDLQKDFPPEDGDFGIIVHPRGFRPPDAGPSNAVSWPAADEIPLNGRTYSIIVDRTNLDEAERQIWFPPATNNPGYEGRWGPLVTPDPLGRRSGMRFPPFVQMFLVALTKSQSS